MRSGRARAPDSGPGSGSSQTAVGQLFEGALKEEREKAELPRREERGREKNKRNGSTVRLCGIVCIFYLFSLFPSPRSSAFSLSSIRAPLEKLPYACGLGPPRPSCQTPAFRATSSAWQPPNSGPQNPNASRAGRAGRAGGWAVEGRKCRFWPRGAPVVRTGVRVLTPALRPELGA